MMHLNISLYKNGEVYEETSPTLDEN